MVLIADDSQIIREKMTELFSSVPEIDSISVARDGQEAIEKIKISEPDILLLDLSMPNVSGFDVLKFVKKNSPKTKSIVFTNHSAKPFRKKAIELGCNSFFDKSSEFEFVMSEILRLVKNEIKSK